MRQIAWLTLLAALGCQSTPEQPMDVIHAALVRRGGEQKVRAAGGVVRSSSGTLRGVPFRSTTTYRHPNQLRWELHLEGTDVDVVQVFDGHLAWQATATGPVRLTGAQAQTIRNRAMDETAFWLIALEDPNLTTQLLGRQRFQGQEVVSVKVAHWSGYSRILHFSADSYDLVGSEGLTWTPDGRKPTRAVWSEFRDFDGVRLPTHFVYEMDGEPYMEGSHDSIRFDAVPPEQSFWLKNQGPSARSQSREGGAVAARSAARSEERSARNQIATR